MSIQSFGNKETRDFFENAKSGKRVGWASVSSLVLRKLDMIHYASILEDLLCPPGNRLERLKGDLVGFYSVRVNDKWRIVFKWTSSGPSEVAVVDYHK